MLLWLLLELWPSARHSTLVFRGRDLLLSWMEDCTAVDAPTVSFAAWIWGSSGREGHIPKRKASAPRRMH